MDELKLSPPWQTLFHKLNAMFGCDPEIELELIDEEYKINLFVNNQKKYEALTKLLPEEYVFGNVHVKLVIIPANDEDDDEEDIIDTFFDAFDGNPVMTDAFSVKAPVGVFNYVEFAPKVVQFYNDDLTDPHGLCSTLFEDIAYDLFVDDLDVNYCTEPVDQDDTCAPLGEWP